MSESNPFFSLPQSSIPLTLFAVPALHPLLTWMARLRMTDETLSFETTRIALMTHLEQMEQQLRNAAWPHQAIEWASYAVCAGLDEAAIGRCDTLADRWTGQPLQLLRFGEYTAGNGFFERLGSLRSDILQYAPVLNIYWLVLLHGFSGKMALHTGQQRQALIEHIRHELKPYSLDIPTNPPEKQAPQSIARSRIGYWVVPAVWLLCAICIAIVHHTISAHLETDLQAFYAQLEVLKTKDSER